MDTGGALTAGCIPLVSGGPHIRPLYTLLFYDAGSTCWCVGAVGLAIARFWYRGR